MDQTRKDVLILCGLFLFTILLTVLITMSVFNTFVDSWGYNVYYDQNVIPFIQNGSLPYIDHFWEYPVLMMVPVIISAAPSILSNDKTVFFNVFSTLMILCNFIIISCVYTITLSISKDRDRAYLAGFIYTISIPVEYITLTNYDPFPTALMMAGLTLVVTGDGKEKVGGYLAGILGFFTKIYPIVILPFMVLYNAKTTSLKEEILSMAKVWVIPVLVLFIPIFLLNPGSVGTYLISNAAGKQIFVASFVYTVYSWLNWVFGIGVTVSVVSGIMTGILIITMVALLYTAYAVKKQDPALFLNLILVGLVAVIACSKYHSPQYVLWIIPILCILVSGIVQVGVYLILQVVWYIKFPLMFYALYTNEAYTYPLPSAGGYGALLLFTVEYAILFWLVWSVTSPVRQSLTFQKRV